MSSDMQFIEYALVLEKDGHFDTSLDVIYDTFDDLFRQERWHQANEILEQIDVSVLSVDVMLGILTATLPAAHKLEYRSHVFDEVRASLAARNELDDTILMGLE